MTGGPCAPQAPLRLCPFGEHLEMLNQCCAPALVRECKIRGFLKESGGATWSHVYAELFDRAFLGLPGFSAAKTSTKRQSAIDGRDDERKIAVPSSSRPRPVCNRQRVLRNHFDLMCGSRSCRRCYWRGRLACCRREGWFSSFIPRCAVFVASACWVHDCGVSAVGWMGSLWASTHRADDAMRYRHCAAATAQ